MDKPTVIDPPTPVDFKEGYDGIPGRFWRYDISMLESIQNAKNFSLQAEDLYAKIQKWMPRRIAYLKLQQTISGDR